ncbi:MAG TPA: prepilin-type N-terminal cleavage/methylation domain-containing protein, partial [Acetobacteraceae bacterium]|nr:prepilin-type N-terminal cleavage/methylation domain-containing protein [Acetobacteraceae bacterium]
MPPAARQAGFTLLEVLVALVVLGFLVAGLSGAVRGALAAWQAQTAQVAREEGLEAAETLLRGLIGRMSPADLSSRIPTLVGTASGMSFVTTLPQAAGALPTRAAEASLVLANREAQLRWTPHYRNPIRPPPAPERITLLRDVERLELAYWEPQQGWRAEWQDPQLPQLIRIRLAFAKASKRNAPDIV